MRSRKNRSMSFSASEQNYAFLVFQILAEQQYRPEQKEFQLSYTVSEAVFWSIWSYRLAKRTAKKRIVSFQSEIKVIVSAFHIASSHK